MREIGRDRQRQTDRRHAHRETDIHIYLSSELDPVEFPALVNLHDRVQVAIGLAL